MSRKRTTNTIVKGRDLTVKMESIRSRGGDRSVRSHPTSVPGLRGVALHTSHTGGSRGTVMHVPSQLPP